MKILKAIVYASGIAACVAALLGALGLMGAWVYEKAAQMGYFGPGWATLAIIIVVVFLVAFAAIFTNEKAKG